VQHELQQGLEQQQYKAEPQLEQQHEKTDTESSPSPNPNPNTVSKNGNYIEINTT
jgi:hypothetical protein